jgi:hypothetical protein
LVYSGKKGEPLISNSYKSYTKNINRVLTKNEESRLSDLRDWSDNFFFKNSLKYINWWNDWKKPDDNATKLAGVHEKIDLILKCVGTDGGKKNKVSFIDKDGVTFDLLMMEKASLKIGQVIKLRCVEILAKKPKDTTRMIKLTSLSSCLLMPPFSSDYRQFDKANNDKRSPAKANKNEVQLPFLADYAVEETAEGKSTKSTPKKGPKAQGEKYITAIKKLYQNKKQVTITQLLQNLENYHSNHGQKFVIKGYIAGFVNTDPKSIIKKLTFDEKKVYDLSDNSEKKDKKNKIIYHFVMHVKDDSVEKSDKFLDVYVLTGEYESHLFSTWNILPNNDDIGNWNAIKDSKLNEFEKKLKSVKNPGMKVKLAVELMVTKQGKPFYRLVDTVFLPF